MSQPAEVWIVDDDEGIRWVLERAMEQAGGSGTRSPCSRLWAGAGRTCW